MPYLTPGYAERNKLEAAAPKVDLTRRRIDGASAARAHAEPHTSHSGRAPPDDGWFMWVSYVRSWPILDLLERVRGDGQRDDSALSPT